MRNLLALIAAIAIMSFAPSTQAAIVWSEDFSDVSDWGVVYDPDGGSTITASGGLGAMYIDKASSQAAFAPNQTDANFISFDPTNASDYTLYWDVDSLTGSVGWDIAMDQFNSGKSHLSTIWNIYPESGNCGETGELSKNLSGFGWDSSTAYIIPKVSVHTGEAAQTAYFDSIEMDVVPEPTTMMLLGSGLMGLFAISRKRR